MYSQDTCIFIPAKLNSCINFYRRKASKLPIGVSNSKSKFRTSYVDSSGTRCYKYGFTNKMDAHFFYLTKKIERIIAVNSEIEDPSLDPHVSRYCEWLQLFIDTNKEFI